MHIPFSRTIIHDLEVIKLRKQLEVEKWDFTQTRFDMIYGDSKEWGKYYLPIGVVNKTVLDVGAGEGETARFYLKNGAKAVICIEPDGDSAEILMRNSVNHNEIEVVYLPFFPELMDDYKHDFMKMDIEGYEELLLSVPPKKPSVIEIHGLQQIDKFRKAGWRVLEPNTRFGCTTYAYWSC